MRNSSENTTLKAALPRNQRTSASTMNRTDALAGLRVLSETQIRRDLEISRQPTIRSIEEDDDADGFYLGGGNTGIMKMVNLSAREFQRLYNVSI